MRDADNEQREARDAEVAQKRTAQQEILTREAAAREELKEAERLAQKQKILELAKQLRTPFKRRSWRSRLYRTRQAGTMIGHTAAPI